MLLELALPLSGMDMSLRMYPEFVALSDAELINNVDSESVSSLGASASFYSDREDPEISSV